MEISGTPIEGLKIIKLDKFSDNRGFFIERYSKNKFKANGLPTNFVQDNHSRSTKGVIRGLHFQPNPAQGKMVGCINGRIWDVAVDIRPESETYGQYFGIELSSDNATLLWIPPGFAHGFCVLGDNDADVSYKITSHYNPKGETGIAWNDPDINVQWPLDEMSFDKEPVTSIRDTEQQSFADYRKSPLEWIEANE